MRKFTRVPARKCKHAKNIRGDLGDEDAAKAVARSRAKCQQQPLLLAPLDADGLYPVLDGNRTLWGLTLLGMLDVELDVIITDETLDDAARAKLQLISAVHRKGLALYDRCEAMHLIESGNPKATGQQLAEELDIDNGTVTRLRSYGDLIDAGKEAVKAGKLTDLIKMYDVAKLPPEDQAAALQVALNGTRADLANHTRKRTTGVKGTKIKCPLPSGQTVVISGNEIDLESAIEAASTVVKLMKGALADGYNIKTAQSMWRDKAV